MASVNLDILDEAPEARRGEQPTGAEFTDDGYQLVVTTAPRTSEPSPAELNDLLRQAGFDPDEFEVDPTRPMRVGGSEVTSWQDGEPTTVWNRNFRFMLRRKVDAEGRAFRADVDELVKSIRAKRPVKRTAAATSAGFVVAVSDLQIGKARESMGGTAETVERYKSAFAFKVAEMRRRKPAHVVLAMLGDVVEGCTGFHSIASRIDLDNREQMRVASHLMLWTLDQVVALPFVERVTLSGIPSNHGEQRVGKGVTVTDPWRDNKDLQLLDRLAEATHGNERYDRVEIVQPTDEHPEGVTLEVDGKRLFCHHGHMMSPSGKARSSPTNRLGVVRQWWQSAEHNQRVSADMMLVGHGHVFMVDDARKPIMQAPAGDGGSEWFSIRTGAESPPGLLSFLFGESADPSGFRVWADATIH